MGVSCELDFNNLAKNMGFVAKTVASQQGVRSVNRRLEDPNARQKADAKPTGCRMSILPG